MKGLSSTVFTEAACRVTKKQGIVCLEMGVENVNCCSEDKQYKCHRCVIKYSLTVFHFKLAELAASLALKSYLIVYG